MDGGVQGIASSVDSLLRPSLCEQGGSGVQRSEEFLLPFGQILVKFRPKGFTLRHSGRAGRGIQDQYRYCLLRGVGVRIRHGIVDLVAAAASQHAVAV